MCVCVCQSRNILAKSHLEGTVVHKRHKITAHIYIDVHQRKKTFDRRRPLMEDNLQWKTTFNGRRHSMEDSSFLDQLVLLKGCTD